MLEKVLTGKLTFKSLKPCDLSSTNKNEIKEYFENSYDLNESLYTALKDESVFYKCPDRLRLPLIFYYGHTASVYINKFILAGLIQPCDRVNLEFETLFETGVDEMSWDDTENYRMGGKYQWPALDDVVEYRRKVRKLVLSIIDKTHLELPVTMDSPWWGLFMGMEHERIHLETSSVLIRQLPVQLLERPDGFIYGPLKSERPVLDNPLLRVPSTNVRLGKPVDFPSYGWDNEYGDITCSVPEFEASKYLVTNREFLEFVNAGGYEKKQYWTSDGWKWRTFREAKHPTFWVCSQGCKSGCGANLGDYSHCSHTSEHHTNNTNGHITNGHVSNGNVTNGHMANGENSYSGDTEFRFRCMFDVIEMPWDWPVDVNFHEAKAFCAWKGPEFHLPIEAEHNVMRGKTLSPDEGTKCDIIYQDHISANTNLQYGSSTPVNLYGGSELGFCDLFGNVWEWVEDHFNGLPGSKTSKLYDDFSGPCFDGKHHIILGGSWISTGDECSRFARFSFRAHFFQHSGFRLVRSVSKEAVHLPARFINTPVCVGNQQAEIAEVNLPDNISYDSVPSTYAHYVLDNPVTVNQELITEYDPDLELLRTTLLDNIMRLIHCHVETRSRALHLGCGAGRVSFHLNALFDDVLAQDFSALLIDECMKLQNGDHVTFKKDDVNLEAQKPDIKTENIITFKQLTWLTNEVGTFDFALSSFFDRVQNVEAWTVRLPEVVKSGGLLLVTSANKWTEESLSPLLSNSFTLKEAFDITNGTPDHSFRLTAWIRK